jgi:hypothetical protein
MTLHRSPLRTTLFTTPPTRLITAAWSVLLETDFKSLLLSLVGRKYLALTEINGKENEKKKPATGSERAKHGETHLVEIIAAAFGPTKAQLARELPNSQLKSSTGCHDLEEKTECLMFFQESKPK